MIRDIRKAPKVALCRMCKGTGKVTMRISGDVLTCRQCEGSGRVLVSYEMKMEINPYKPTQET